MGPRSLANLPFKFVHSYRDRHGKTRHYFRRPGCKSVTLPGVPGSAEFMEAYQAALAGESAPRIEIGAARTKPGSVAAAVALYLGSIDFGSLAHATRRDRRRILERFRETYGERSFAGLERQHVEPMVAAKAATPHAARSFLKALRAVVAIAIRAGFVRGRSNRGNSRQGARDARLPDMDRRRHRAFRDGLSDRHPRAASVRAIALYGAAPWRRHPHGPSACQGRLS